MNALKKILVAWVMATASFSFAANNGVGGYWVDNIVPNAWAVQNTLMQSVTKANYACGPTSLLFASNHYRRLDTGQNSPNMSTITSSTATLVDMYKYLNDRKVYGLVPYNTAKGTDLTQLKDIAVNKFGWTNTSRMYGDGRVSVATNMDNLINYLNQNIPALGVLKAGYSGNPVGNFNHIVVLWGYTRNKDESGRAVFDPNNTRNNDTIHWYEPYYGKTGTVRRGDWSSSFDMAYFSFLKIGR